MNKVILMGRLTADPQLKQTANGIQLCNFSIAVNRRFAKEGQQLADFINCTSWRQTAEFICKYFKKGNMIAAVGNIQTRCWEDENKNKQYATNVVVEEVYFTGSKAEAQGNQQSSELHSAEPNFDDFGDMELSDMGTDDDLPF